MNYFIYNNRDSRDYDIVVNKLPPISSAPKRYEEVVVAGKDGATFNEEGYSTYEKQLTITIMDKNKIDEILEWLQGNGQITFSNEPDKYYNVYFLNSVEINREKTQSTLNMIVQPYKYSNNETIINTLIVVNEGNVISNPWMRITGSGTIILKINNVNVCTLDLSVISSIDLDSDLQEAFNNGQLANRKMNGEFPRFKPGINTISCTGNVTKVETIVRSRWL